MESVNYGKLPPQAPELEEAILGAIMIEPRAAEIALDIITTSEAFYSDANQQIYAAIQRLFAKGAGIDFMTVSAELRAAGELESVGGSYYVTALTGKVVSSAHLEHHCRIVLEKYMLRKVIAFAGDTLGEAFDTGADCFDLMDKIGSFATDITSQIIKKPYSQIGSGLTKLIESTMALSTRENKLVGVPTGYRELNRITGGWIPTDLIIIAARPSVGKTAFVLNLILNAATDPEQPVAVGMFSLEMSEPQLLQRLMANAADISLEQIKSGALNPVEMEHFMKTAEHTRKLPIYIDDTSSLNITTLRAKALKMKRDHNIGLLVIDYLQLMSGESRNNQNREQEISKISRELKMLAKDIQVPVIALSQMSRAVDSRSSNVPKLSDLRESGAIEQDADLVAFLYANSESMLKEMPFKSKERHLKIAKHRNGSLADLIYDFEGSRQRFYNEEMTVMDIAHTEVKQTFKLADELPMHGNLKVPAKFDREIPF